MRRLRPLLAALGVTAVALALPASAGVPPGQSARTISYEVRTAGGPAADLTTFRRVAAQTFNDRRGWSLGGSIRYREVASGGSFTLWLAAPSAVPTFSSACSSSYSCRVGRHVIINDARWRLGTSTWPDVREYRHYVLNHELGHWLGLGHRSCSGSGQPAPVMQQQSKSLQGCARTTWPLAAERGDVGRRLGLGVRSTRADLWGVQPDGATGTEVRVTSGGSSYASFALRTSTLLPALDSARWEWLVADRNLDGVDDLVGVLRQGASGTVEVHVVDGASGFTRWQTRLTTPLPAAPGEEWAFDVDDVDADGALDLVAFAHLGGSRTTEMHVLSGASGFTRWLARTSTALGRTDHRLWDLTLGDHDRDGYVDVYAVTRRGTSGRTEVHVLDGRSRWQRFSAHVTTPLGAVATSWRFLAGDHDGDGFSEVFAVDQANGGSGRVEVHVLADRTYNRWTLHAKSAQQAVPAAAGWWFDVA